MAENAFVYTLTTFFPSVEKEFFLIDLQTVL